MGRTDSIALPRLAELLFQYLTAEIGLSSPATAETIWRDYTRGGRRDKPEFLRAYVPDGGMPAPPHRRSAGMKRQARHLAGSRDSDTS